MKSVCNGRQHRYWKIVPATLKNLVAFETAAAGSEMRSAKYGKKLFATCCPLESPS